jgi:hypothetical protein
VGGTGVALAHALWWAKSVLWRPAVRGVSVLFIFRMNGAAAAAGGGVSGGVSAAPRGFFIILRSPRYGIGISEWAICAASLSLYRQDGVLDMPFVYFVTGGQRH